jgi:hypothetical protein
MEQATSPLPETSAPALAPVLSVVRAPLQFAQPDEPAPPEWDDAIGQLLDWIGIAPEWLPEGQAGGAPLFAPWRGWSPAAFQLGGAPGLPQAHFAASYCLEHARAAATGKQGTDVLLMSPHPATCTPLPEPGLLDMMLRVSRGEGRGRIAVVGHARHRGALAAMVQGTREGDIDILAVEDALPPLASGRVPWDAIIAMPEWRGTVFTMLAEASGVRGAWPMLWIGEAGPLAVTCEVAGEGAAGTMALDAPALVHGLALALNAAGAARAARRLHDAWARLRDSGVTTAGRGSGDAPYATQLGDIAFLALLCKDGATSKRSQTEWLALRNEKSAGFGSQFAPLRVVT